MSGFGWSAGDLLLIVNFAYTTYQKCKSSTKEYRNIGHEVGNAHIVLRAIHQFWAAEESRGRQLPLNQQEELKQLAGDCNAVLKELAAIRKRHHALADSGNVVYRVKYVIRDALETYSSIRQRLQQSVSNLAILNATFTAGTLAEAVEGASNKHLKILNDQAQILKFFALRLADFESGRREAEPAFSQHAKTLRGDDRLDALKNIEAELRDENVEVDAIDEQQLFIEEWIATVIPTDQDNESDEAENSDRGRTSLNLAEQCRDTQQSTSIDLTPGVGVELSTAGSRGGSVERRTSIDSHRSQDSLWEDPADERHNAPALLIATVFGSKYPQTASENMYLLPIRRAFRILDWTSRGWLTQRQVQSQCHDAASLAGHDVSEDVLDEIIQAACARSDRQDHQVDIEAFVDIIKVARQHLYQCMIGRAKELALELAGIWLALSLGSRKAEKSTPLGWVHEADFEGPLGELLSMFRESRLPVYCHRLVGKMTQTPPLQKNLTNAIAIATGYCTDAITYALEGWRVPIKSMEPEMAAEYSQTLNTTLQAVTKFHSLKHHRSSYHPLDDMYDRALLTPLEIFPVLENCPLELIQSLRYRVWELLKPVLWFVYDVGFTEIRGLHRFRLSEVPPPILRWRWLRMCDRAASIEDLFRSFGEIEAIAKSTGTWAKEHENPLQDEGEQCIANAQSMRNSQRQLTAFQLSKFYDIQLKDLHLDEQSFDTSREPPTALYDVTNATGLVLFRSPVENLYSFLSSSSSSKFTVAEDDILEISFFECGIYEKKHPMTRVGSFKVNMAELGINEGTSRFQVSEPLDGDPHYRRMPAPPTLSMKIRVSRTRAWLDCQDDNDLKLQQGVINGERIPPEWEARRTRDGRVYFQNIENSKATATLWLDPMPTASWEVWQPRPLPLNWRPVFDKGQVMYIEGGRGEMCKRPPDSDDLGFSYLEAIKFEEVSEFVTEERQRELGWREERRRELGLREARAQG